MGILILFLRDDERPGGTRGWRVIKVGGQRHILQESDAYKVLESVGRKGRI